ncbi:toxin-antitoxin system YwqK family antitoxin [Gilvibacter sp.]|uniref:toxin-antitoxin system YwqK family antitoxin n=1 Tax=Gilvibacter sp. TaxID=2729997 RepID=UPI003F49F7D5
MKKQGVFLYTAIAIASCLLMSFGQDYLQKRMIRGKDYDHHFYIFTKARKAERDKLYHWFKAGELHQSFGATGGYVLHKEYLKYYSDNQLAEKGAFHYGLKTGQWKSWHPNGTYASLAEWQNGSKNGDYLAFDEAGNLLTSGRYKRDLKQGVWVDHSTKDTLWYKDGIAHKEPLRDIKRREDSLAGKRPLFKRIFGGKPKDSTAADSSRPGFFKRVFGPRQQDSTATDSTKRRGFFGRLFSKKDKGDEN